MKTILLIEDDEFIRDNTAEILGLAGYAVQPAENGRVGIALALATRPDLVLCDIMMPVLDGYGVLAMFTQNSQLAGVPFIFLTAKTELTDLRRGMELGADDYLTKPFDQATLLRAVASRLHRFAHLKPDYDLRADGLGEFLADARTLGNLASLSLDRKPHLVRKRQGVYLEGDDATRVYFVQSGRIKTLKTTAGGKELITGLYGPGEFLGYLTLLEGTPHRDSAVAVDDSELVYIPQDDFLQLLLRNREVSQQFIRLLAGRVSEREQQLLEMAYNSIRRRVADVLVRLQAEAPATDIHLSREDMASLVGMAPESLIRTLSEFRQSGFIELLPNTIHVVQLDKLRQAAW
jgi:CRP-like cAMP-binding protein/ActR/RegA family two-component response regulator